LAQVKDGDNFNIRDVAIVKGLAGALQLLDKKKQRKFDDYDDDMTKYFEQKGRWARKDYDSKRSV
jgi:hypothetical protein